MVPLSQSSPRLTKNLTYEEVKWRAIGELLAKKQEFSTTEAKKIINHFRQRISSPLNVDWRLRPQLSESEVIILKAIRGYHHCDVVSISYGHQVRLGIFSIPFEQSFDFPSPEDQEEGEYASARYLVVLGSRRIELRSLFSLILFHLISAALLIISFISASVLLLYGLSVMTILVQAPLGTTAAAVSNPTIGLALACFLTVLAGFFGKAIRVIRADLKNRAGR